MTRIVLMRHAETKQNLHGVFQGQTDEPLHEVGIKRFNKIAQSIHDLPLAAIYCSGFQRARASARILNDKRAQLPIVALSIGERHLGILDGQLKANVAAKRPHIFQELMSLNFRPPHGESAAECVERFQHTFEKIVMSHRSTAPVIVVSHGGVCALFIHHIFGAPVNNCYLDHGAFHVIDVDVSGNYWLTNIGLSAYSLREILI